MSFVLTVVPFFVFLWVVILLDLRATLRWHKTMNELMHEQVRLRDQIEPHMWLLYGMLLVATVDVAVLSWITLR